MPRRLQNDHALALLRLVWVFLMPLFPALGYSPIVIAQALAMMYALYVGADALQMLVAWPICAPSERNLMREYAVYLPFLPLYRMVTYLFRLSGILTTLSENPQWSLTPEWVERLKMPGSSRLVGWMGSLVEVWSE